MSNLPTIAELFEDNIQIAYKNERLNLLLNTEPPAKWVKVHPFIKNYQYIPIDKIEFLLRKIFKSYNIEVLREGTAFNGVFVVVRVHYLNPVTGIKEFHDGIGACQLQTKKDTSPSDLININNGALSMAFPIAKTIAVKDACDHFGKLFGCDLNRKDVIPFEADKSLNIDTVSNKVEKKRIILYITNAKNINELLLVASSDDLRAELLQRHDLIDLYDIKFSELSEKEM